MPDVRPAFGKLPHVAARQLRRWLSCRSISRDPDLRLSTWAPRRVEPPAGVQIFPQMQDLWRLIFLEYFAQRPSVASHHRFRAEVHQTVAYAGRCTQAHCEPQSHGIDSLKATTPSSSQGRISTCPEHGDLSCFGRKFSCPLAACTIGLLQDNVTTVRRPSNPAF
jgi:hypothetical protein